MIIRFVHCTKKGIEQSSGCVSFVLDTGWFAGVGLLVLCPWACEAGCYAEASVSLHSVWHRILRPGKALLPRHSEAVAWGWCSPGAQRGSQGVDAYGWHSEGTASQAVCMRAQAGCCRACYFRFWCKVGEEWKADRRVVTCWLCAPRAVCCSIVDRYMTQQKKWLWWWFHHVHDTRGFPYECTGLRTGTYRLVHTYLYKYAFLLCLWDAFARLP